MTIPNRQKIAIADKSPVIRTGLADIFKRDGRFEVAAAVSTGRAFLELTKERAIDIGVIGWTLPDMTGGDVLREIRKCDKAPRIIVYTGEPAGDVLRQTIKGGAWGFISKSDEPSVIVETISSVAHGRLCFPYIDFDALSRGPARRVDGARARAVGRARQRLVEPADRVPHRHLPQHGEVPPEEPLR